MITTNRIVAGDDVWRALTDDQRRDLEDLVDEIGFNPAEIHSITVSTVVDDDGDQVNQMHLLAYRVDADGNRYIDKATGEPASTEFTTTVPFLLPEWWTPA